uniref:Uncharacterized protein n=1 Tax=Triticum urartu TaxID=4572 RepID=A0A8R7V8H8_TRIUA
MFMVWRWNSVHDCSVIPIIFTFLAAMLAIRTQGDVQLMLLATLIQLTCELSNFGLLFPLLKTNKYFSL